MSLKGYNKNPDGTTPQTIDEKRIQGLFNIKDPSVDVKDDLEFVYPRGIDALARWSDAEAKLFTLLFRLLSDNEKLLKANGITCLDIELFTSLEICPSCWAIMNQFVAKCTSLGFTINLEFDFAGETQYPYYLYTKVGYPPSWRTE